MNSGATVIAVAAGATALLTWVLVAILIRLAPRLGLLDRPNERSLHIRVTPRGGGIGFVVPMALAPGVLLALGFEIRVPLLVCLGAALIIAAVSLRDDFKSLSTGVRLLCQLTAAGAAIAASGHFERASAPGLGPVSFGWWGIGLTMIWIVGMTNVYNFMDGIDGIAGIQGLVAGLAWAALGWRVASAEIALLGAMLAGGCLGFLFHNWSPAKIFMGDVGSAFLGFIFAVIPLLALRDAVPAGRAVRLRVALPLFALLVVWPFVADGIFTFIRRVLHQETVWKAHRTHLYQRLVRVGWSHARVSGLYALWCALSAGVGFFWLTGSNLAAASAAVFLVFSLAGMVALVGFCERRAGQSRT